MTTLFDRGEKIELVPSPDEWNYAYIDRFIRGLNKVERPDNLEDAQLLIADGVRPEKSRVVIDQGYADFGNTLLGTPRKSFTYARKTGTEHFLLITNLTLYEWNVSEVQWQLVPTSTTTTLSGAEAEGQTVLGVADETGFSADDPIGIILSDGQEHVSTVASTGANEITINDAIVAPGADSGASVVKGIPLAGVNTEAVSCVTYAASDLFIFTNGVDEPVKYDGTTVAALAHNLGSTLVCKVLGIFNNHLIFLNTTEGGTKLPQRIRNSDTADPEELLTGNAGTKDLFDNSQPITGAEILGPYLIVYKTKTIYRMEFVGDVTRLFKVPEVVSKVGIPNPNAVTKVEDVHVIFADDNVYEYDGGFDVEPLGEAILEIVFDNVANLNRAAIGTVIVEYIAELKEIWIFYPTGADTLPKDMIRIARIGGGWFTRKFAIGITGIGFFQIANAATGWDELIGSWLDQIGSWIGNPERSSNATVQLMSGTGTNQVYEYDYIQPQDDGVDINYEVETKDFYIPNRNLRFDRLDVSLRGNTIKVFLSMDGGNDWTQLDTVSPGALFQDVVLARQKFGRRIRFKFTGSGNGFGLEGIGFRYKKETIW